MSIGLAIRAEKNHPLAHSLLNTYQLPHSSLITDTEWEELELDSLATILDNTLTSFGAIGLKRLLIPVAAKEPLLIRQQMMRGLMDSNELYTPLVNFLTVLGHYEGGILAFFDQRNPLNTQAHELYYHLPLGEKVNKMLNNSSVALEGSFFLNLGYNLLYIVSLLCLDGVRHEIEQWIYSDNYNLDIVRGLNKGLKDPIRQHSWEPTEYFQKTREKSDFKGWSFKDYLRVTFFGSLGDRYRILKDGYSSMGLSDDPALVKGSSTLVALGMAAIPTVLSDIARLHQFSTVYKNIKSSYCMMQAMHRRMVTVASWLATVQQLGIYMKKYENGALRGLLPSVLIEPFKNASPALQELMSLLASSTFKKAPMKLYSRGKVLRAYQLCYRVKEELIPYLHALAQLDAYVGIATTLKEWQAQQLPFCFVTFDTQEGTYLDIRDGWSPIFKGSNPVSNTIVCGRTDFPLKIIITGPNGCGKSSALKMMGQSVVMAQSVGIAPATECSMSFLHGLRTSLQPEADMLKGLSSYMAQAQSMQRLEDFIRGCTHYNKGLGLIDEPYKGTVDAESASRIISFGNRIASVDTCIVGMAVHVQQATLLAETGRFANYHVEVQELVWGSFMRTYKLIPGVADWWFNDAPLRTRFVDWISVQK